MAVMNPHLFPRMKMRKRQHDNVQLRKLVDQHDIVDVTLRNGGKVADCLYDVPGDFVVGDHEFHAPSCFEARFGKKLTAKPEQLRIEQTLNAKLFGEHQADLAARRALPVGLERKQLLAVFAEHGGIGFQHISGSSCGGFRAPVSARGLSNPTIAGGTGTLNQQGDRN
jgi:hypothetical protein